MRTLTSAALLSLALTALPGCDDDLSFDAEFAGDGDVTARCVGSGCTVGGLGNTSRIGDHALSNLSRALGVNAANVSANVKITGGTGYWNGALKPIYGIDLEADGELRLNVGTAWIQGTAVKNAKLDVLVTPLDPNRPAFTGKLWIWDVACTPGKYDASMSICAYQFLTNVLPSDTVAYPMHPKAFGWYHTCPAEDEQGALSGWEMYSAVLSPNATLVAPSGSTPAIHASPGYFINGCLNGAVSKGQYWLNAFYDASVYRGLDPSQRTAMLLMWMAWFDGATRTIPGQKISPHDPLHGLFTWTNSQFWDIEAGYGSAGASCRGGSLAYGLHRLIPEPVLNLAGWSNLVHCDAGDIASKAVLGVKVEVVL